MVDVMFPQKGLNTNYPRNNQPDGTSADLLNAVPYDRDQRNRGASRTGVTKFVQAGTGANGTPLGSGAPVLLMEQITTALDPSSVSPTTQLVNETFTYANGTIINANGTTNIWDQRGTDTVFSGTVTNDCSVTSNQLIVNHSGRSFRYIPTVSLGVAYVIKADFKVASISGTWDIDIAFRADPSSIPTSGNTGVRLEMSRVGSNNTMAFRQFNNNTIIGASANGPTLTDDTIFTFELRVSGNQCTGWINGVQYLGPITVTAAPTGTAFGFMVGSNASSNTVTVDNFKVFSAQPLASFRQTSLVAVSNGNVYLGNANLGLTIATNGSGVLSAVVKPQSAARLGYVFFVDGQHDLQVLNTVSNVVSTALMAANNTETATTLGTNTLACVWRDRLVLAAPATNAQNFFMSRQGTVPNGNGTISLDFDYTQTDPAAAVAGNAAKAGAIGEPLNCLIPWTDDVLILGGDHDIYKVEGDIAAGGQILLVSDEVGTLGADCWATDPEGNLYFVGTNGLYKMSPGSTPQNLSNDAIREFFVNIDRTANYVVLVWDRDRNGLWIHVTPVNTGTATHMFWDAGEKGFFPIRYPDTQGPISGVVFDGDAALDRQLLLGGRDGYIRKIDPSTITDDGTAISSYVFIGPYRPAGDAAISILEAVEIIFGDPTTGFTQNTFGANITIQSGNDAYHALLFPERTFTQTVDQRVGRRKRLLQRLAGGTWFFKISGIAGRVWSMEKLVALFTEGGLQRRVLTNQD